MLQAGIETHLNLRQVDKLYNVRLPKTYMHLNKVLNIKTMILLNKDKTLPASVTSDYSSIQSAIIETTPNRNNSYVHNSIVLCNGFHMKLNNTALK